MYDGHLAHLQQYVSGFTCGIRLTFFGLNAPRRVWPAKCMTGILPICYSMFPGIVLHHMGGGSWFVPPPLGWLRMCSIYSYGFWFTVVSPWAMAAAGSGARFMYGIQDSRLCTGIGIGFGVFGSGTVAVLPRSLSRHTKKKKKESPAK